MYSMAALTEKQSKILQYVEAQMQAGLSPTIREVARHFRFKSNNSAVGHIQALVKKGFLLADEGKARSLRLVKSLSTINRPSTAEIPLFGSIPAGFGDDTERE